jgi:formylglycine-generating enzyme required for sulfatase activity
MILFWQKMSLLFFVTLCQSLAEDNPPQDPPCHCDKTSKAAAILASHKKTNLSGMVKIPSGTFLMGNHHPKGGKPDESPVHPVKVDSFYMDETPVTNEQFDRFVSDTGYKTTAEKPVDWELLKLQLPPNTPKPPEDKLSPGSLVFVPPTAPVPLDNTSRWWQWINGASWRAPKGPDSQTFGKDHPVVHVSLEDAQAYCLWQGKRLPTEAEWEWAARGGLENKKYPWGDEETEDKAEKANIWKGHFPHQTTKPDNERWTSPVRKYPPNGYGLYDMSGNVWEWTSDLYDATYYQSLKNDGTVSNPKNSKRSFDPDEPNTKKYAIRGGSFMCHPSYCWGYRVSARMKTTSDSSMMNLGFRCVKKKGRKN